MDQRLAKWQRDGGEERHGEFLQRIEGTPILKISRWLRGFVALLVSRNVVIRHLVADEPPRSQLIYKLHLQPLLAETPGGVAHTHCGHRVALRRR